jgi:hypothetical protein
MSELLLDRAGRRRSPATMPGFHAGRPPRNKGLRYPADPARIEEIVAGLARRWRRRARPAAARPDRDPLACWATDPGSPRPRRSDLDHGRGALLVRRGKGGRRREVGMDQWGWDELHSWLELRSELPVAPLFCVINGSTQGRPLVQRRRPSGHAPDRRRGWRPPTLRAAPAPARSCRRVGSRRRAPDCHPASAWPQQPGRHVDLPARHRQRRSSKPSMPAARP